ncbi:MAG: TusE/DsrC/DsvC family sulfur relay protein [Gammaproteobacteria bacterium]
MNLDVEGKLIETNKQGFINNTEDWSVEFTAKLAEHENIELHVDHWELILYFREYYIKNLINPTMHELILTLGNKKDKHFHETKEYEKHISHI